MPYSSLRDLPNPGIEPGSLNSPALIDWFFTTSITWEAQVGTQFIIPTGCTQKRITLFQKEIGVMVEREMNVEQSKPTTFSVNKGVLLHLFLEMRLFCLSRIP